MLIGPALGVLDSRLGEVEAAHRSALTGEEEGVPGRAEAQLHDVLFWRELPSTHRANAEGCSGTRPLARPA